MMTKEWWAQIGGEIAGPLTTDQLCALASLGRIVPETMVSLDKVEWRPAAKVRGLFPTEPHPRREAPAEAQFPIIRVEQGAFKKRVVAIYPDHVLLGKRRWSLEITEEMCHVSGEPALMDHLGRYRSVMFDDLRDVRETASTFQPKPTRPNPPENLKCRFEYRANKGKSFKIDMPLSQVGHVRRALSQSLEDRFLVKKRGLSRLARFIGLLFWIAAIVLVVFCISAYMRGDAGAFISLITSGVACSLAGYCLRSESRRGFMSLDEYEAKLREKAQKTTRKPVLEAKPPRRSQRLGWTLKIVGFLLWIAVSSSLPDRFIEKVYNATHSASAWQLYRLIAFPATWFVLLGYKLCQREYDPKEAGDPRRPILFLRPFEEDDAVSLQPPGFLSTLAGIRGDPSPYGGTSVSDGRTSETEYLLTGLTPIRLLRLMLDRGVGSAEESIVRYFETRGPVRAIGKPGERLATAGASRMYLDDATWEQAILDLLQRAQAVVMIPGSSKGVQRELELVRDLIRDEKFTHTRLLLCLASYWRNPQRYEEVAGVLGRILGVTLPRAVPHLIRPSFVYFDRNWTPRLQVLSYRCPAVWPITADAADLNYTLAPFVQGMDGGDREPPRIPRWTGGPKTNLARAAAVCVAVLISMVPTSLIDGFMERVLGQVPAAQETDLRDHRRQARPNRGAFGLEDHGRLPPELQRRAHEEVERTGRRSSWPAKKAPAALGVAPRSDYRWLKTERRAVVTSDRGRFVPPRLKRYS